MKRRRVSREARRRTDPPRFDRTTENRGVPDSSPGLAIVVARNARWLLDLGLSGVLDAILDLGLGSADLGLAG
jgi:hypothetical protein